MPARCVPRHELAAAAAKAPSYSQPHLIPRLYKLVIDPVNLKREGAVEAGLEQGVPA